MNTNININKFQNKFIEKYINEHTTLPSIILKELALVTKNSIVGATMLSDHLIGRLLKLLVIISKSKKILEIGTYTGYATLSMAEGLPNDGTIVTCEIDPTAIEYANKYFKLSPHHHKIKIMHGPALFSITTIDYPLDLVFIDADKTNYKNYYDIILPKLKPSGLIIIDNALWHQEVIEPKSKQAKIIDALNKQIINDPKVENILLNIKDGINIVYKK